VDAKPEPTYLNLTRHAFKDDMNGLFAAGEQVELLLGHPGWQAIARVVDLDRAGIEAKLNGLLDSRAEYAHYTARRAALNSFQEAAHAIVSHAATKLAEQQRKHETAGETAAR
jgi:hypothetical protein